MLRETEVSRSTLSTVCRASFQMHGICCLYRNILCQLDILQGASDINAVIPMF